LFKNSFLNYLKVVGLMGVAPSTSCYTGCEFSAIRIR